LTTDPHPRIEQSTLDNLGRRPLRPLPQSRFADADLAVAAHGIRRPPHKVDILLVNPPAPDGAIWIRSQHRVGRRSRENMIWPQVSLAQLAALLYPDYTVEIVDAIALRMTWPQFETLLREKRPRYYVTHLTAPTLTNDMYGAFLARALGATTITFGTHVTPIPRETMRSFPSLDFALRGEPELSLRELIDTAESEGSGVRGPESGGDERGAGNSSQSGDGETGRTWRVLDGRLVGTDGKAADADGRIARLCRDADPDWTPAWSIDGREEKRLAAIKGLVWRRGDEVVVNPDRPFIRNLDDLPLPLHRLLPLQAYTAPMMKGPFTFIVTSRGCTAGCKFCIKHVSYQYSIRVRSPESVMEELRVLDQLGIHNINMYADLFTVSREHVVGLCNLIIKEGLKIRWMCNSRVDYVDEEMLRLMGKAGCWMMSWGIESANEQILKTIHKGYKPEQVAQALGWAKKAGIMNWGYFIIGLPGETAQTIKQTIAYAKTLPLDIALFHIAAPYPGTPFFFEVLENKWFRPGTQWEEIDMDESTVLDYPHLRAEELEYWQKRAFREWVMRPGPALTYLKMLTDPATLRSALDAGRQHLSWLWKRQPSK
jgi:anaerobic magnesium-protoporphyrin IX monomethyl ester cyclase